ncbi:MAG: N-acetylglucosamine-6-phosphate deacetylase [Planctomycetota bacterium]
MSRHLAHLLCVLTTRTLQPVIPTVFGTVVMTFVSFVGGDVVLPDRVLHDGVVVCRDGKIQYVGSAKSRVPKTSKIISVKHSFICPGFIDIHIHGGGGADVMDGDLESVLTVTRAHARHGTTTMFPTTSTASPEQIEVMLASCQQARNDWQIGYGSRVEGAHLYGPYFAKDKAGCHSVDECRAPTAKETSRYFKTDIVKVATCAAELPGAVKFYQTARRRGCLVTCGHSNASWAEMEAGYRAGMRHVDHFWCAMSHVSSVRGRLGVPMQGSMLEFVLDQPEMSTEVIADGMHLAPELLRFAWKFKTPERLCLVTDCNRALDMPPGDYRFGPKQDGSLFRSDGRVGWAPSGSLASSVMGMDHMVRTMHQKAGIPLEQAVRMATLTPAERTGIASRCGSLVKGKDADVVVLSRKLQVKHVYIHGERFPT